MTSQSQKALFSVNQRSVGCTGNSWPWRNAAVSLKVWVQAGGFGRFKYSNKASKSALVIGGKGPGGAAFVPPLPSQLISVRRRYRIDYLPWFRGSSAGLTY